MFVKELHIVNFKNIAEATFTFCPRFNCMVGNNGVGKTNVLDALYLLSMCKSYFGLPDSQNIRHHEPFFVLQGKYERQGEDVDVYCGVKRGQKKVFKKNQKAYEKLSEHIGLLPLVMISPEDVALIDGGSEERRRLVDGIISQSDRNYLYLLIRYNKALQQRNTLLRAAEGKEIDSAILDVWDEQLVACGEKILRYRTDFIRDFRTFFQRYYDLISSGKEQVSLNYNSSSGELEMREALRKALGKDRLLGYTSVGVHRDDLSLTIDEYSVKKIGSQGQKKTFLIALKLAQYAWLYQTNKIKPLLLLDDIFDKLDAGRVKRIIELVGEEIFGQVFITDTNRQHLDDILKAQNVEYKLFFAEGDGSFAE